jgi:hypothetical protein
MLLRNALRDDALDLCVGDVASRVSAFAFRSVQLAGAASKEELMACASCLCYLEGKERP